MDDSVRSRVDTLCLPPKRTRSSSNHTSTPLTLQQSSNSSQSPTPTLKQIVS
eukprot:m.131228 g.131228  ORF g.131228 m.131228 type:complete len:52 (+) comp52365_c0_seq3:2205-2360(+)